jgi:hypothetical protein
MSVLWAVNPISRSQLNSGFGAETGPYRGDSYTLTCPNATSAAATRDVRFTSTPADRNAQIPVIP